VVLGQGGVGKSALVLRFISAQFISRYDPTIEDRHTKVLVHDNIPVVLEILDTAGQDNFSVMRELYYKCGDAFALIYSITQKKTFLSLNDFHQNLKRLREEDPPIVLVGNKSDLEKSREVTYQEGLKQAQDWEVAFVETSAKDGANVNHVFEVLIEELWRINGRPIEKKTKKGCVIL